jgi:L-rhamnonate dehydratase
MIDLLIDAGWYVHRTAKEAIQMVRSIEPFHPFFVEEPLSPEDYDGYAQLAGAVDTLIACGEQEATEWGFQTLIERGQVDVVQPDLSRCGGFTVARKIVHMAERHNRLCIPHAWLSDLLTAASLHLNAFMRRSVFQEFNVTSGPLSRELCKNPIQLEDGLLRVPQGPGLGVEVDEVGDREVQGGVSHGQSQRQGRDRHGRGQWHWPGDRRIARPRGRLGAGRGHRGRSRRGNRVHDSARSTGKP